MIVLSKVESTISTSIISIALDMSTYQVGVPFSM